MDKMYARVLFGLTLAWNIQHEVIHAQSSNNDDRLHSNYIGANILYKESLKAKYHNNYNDVLHHQQKLPYGNLNDANDGQGLDDDLDLQNIQYYSPPNYDFEYQVHGGGNNLGHTESRQDKQINGKYFVDLPNGMRQIVLYTADENGFRPTIIYEPINLPKDYNIVINKNPKTKINQQSSSYDTIPFKTTIRRRRRQRKSSSVHDARYTKFPEFGLRIQR